MKLAYNIFLGIHIVAVLALLGSLLSQLPKSEKRLLPGAMHSAYTALVAGFVMLSLNPAIHNHDAKVALLDHTKFSVKAAILAVIIYLGFSNRKKDFLPTRAWALMTILTVTNVIIATSWK